MTRFQKTSRLLGLAGILGAAVSVHAQWTKTTGPDSVRVLATVDDVTTYAGTAAGVFVTHDSGTTWAAMNNGLTNTQVRSLLLRPGLVFAGTESGGVFRTMNDGASWEPVNDGLTGLDIRALAFHDGHLYAGTDSGVFRSADSGANWTDFNNGLANPDVQALAELPVGFAGALGLYAGTGGGGVFRWSNEGSTWITQNDSLSNLDVRALGNDGPWLFAGTPSGAYGWEAFNATPRWSALAEVPNVEVRSLAGITSPAVHQNEWVLAGTAGSGVFLLRGDGPDSTINQGLTDLDVHAVSGYLPFSHGYLFVGTPSGIWRRPKPEVIPHLAGIKPSEKSTAGFRFSPSGFASFTLPAPGRVTLTAFTPSGRQAAVLLSRDFPAGSHNHRVDASSLPNGLYVFRLQAGGRTESRKVLLSR